MGVPFWRLTALERKPTVDFPEFFCDFALIRPLKKIFFTRFPDKLRVLHRRCLSGKQKKQPDFSPVFQTCYDFVDSVPFQLQKIWMQGREMDIISISRPCV